MNNFTNKLNKVEGKVYVIEEMVTLLNGVYESVLQHDNINVKTLSVYSGVKLTGDKIDSYALSTPGDAPWKHNIRIYTNHPVAYISYETEGDIVEAEDINHVQEVITETQDCLRLEIQRAKDAEQLLDRDIKKESQRAEAAENVLLDRLDYEITRAKQVEEALEGELKAETDRALSMEINLQNSMDSHTELVHTEMMRLNQVDRNLDEKKANAAEMNQELNNRYIKSEVFTKEEVLLKIEDLIGSAPETLDTFKEIAEALGNNPNFATTMMNILSEKVEKEVGKGLSSNDYTDIEKEKLTGIAANAEVNQNAFANAKVGSSIIQANGKTTQIEFAPGDNISLSADNASKKVTIAVDTTSLDADTLDGKHAKVTLTTAEKSDLAAAINEIVDTKSYFSPLKSVSCGAAVAMCKLCTLTCGNTYANTRLVFDIITRYRECTKVLITTTSGSTNSDYNGIELYCDISGTRSDLTCYKVGVNKIEIWLRLKEWDELNVYPKTFMPRGSTLVWDMTLGTVPTAPLSVVQCVLKGADEAKKLTTPRTITLNGAITGNISFDGSQNVTLATTEGTVSFKRMGEINNTTDWNTIKTPGCYKVQITTWGAVATYHGPNEYAQTYSYGMLLVFAAFETDSEKRTIQIYFPHKNENVESALILVRMFNTSAWQAWQPLFKGINKNYIGLNQVINEKQYCMSNPQPSVTGNAGTATKLATTRSIGSANFDGTANITLAQMGAAPSSHNHDTTYLKKGTTWNGIKGV